MKSWRGFVRAAAALRFRLIVITSSDSPQDRARARELGASFYFRKPADLERFMTIGGIVREFLETETDGVPRSLRPDRCQNASALLGYSRIHRGARTRHHPLRRQHILRGADHAFRRSAGAGLRHRRAAAGQSPAGIGFRDPCRPPFFSRTRIGTISRAFRSSRRCFSPTITSRCTARKARSCRCAMCWRVKWSITIFRWSWTSWPRGSAMRIWAKEPTKSTACRCARSR